MRKFGLNNKNRKDPFVWEDVVSFAVAYGIRQQSYCHLVVATMTVLMFGGIYMPLRRRVRPAIAELPLLGG